MWINYFYEIGRSQPYYAHSWTNYYYYKPEKSRGKNTVHFPWSYCVVLLTIPRAKTIVTGSSWHQLSAPKTYIFFLRSFDFNRLGNQARWAIFCLWDNNTIAKNCSRNRSASIVGLKTNIKLRSSSVFHSSFHVWSHRNKVMT